MSSLLGLALFLVVPGSHAFLPCHVSMVSGGMVSFKIQHRLAQNCKSIPALGALPPRNSDGMHRRVRLCMNSEPGQVSETSSLEASAPLRKYGLFGFWISFIAYAFLLAPTGDAEIQQTMIKALIAPPPWDGANPIFASLFILLGVWPAVYAALLLPLKPITQKLPAWPFVAASFGLGAFGLTPYLALTSYAPGPTESESGAARFFGSAGMGIFLLANTVALLLFALGVFAPNDLNGGSDYPVDVIFYTYLRQFGELFSSLKLVNVPSCDFLALWALSSKPLLEDMRRRGWYRGGAFDLALFVSFMLAPLVGACAWLAVRPPLPSVSPTSPETAVVDKQPDQNGGDMP